MVNADDKRSLSASGGAGDKFSKRPFAAEIYEEPQNVSHEAGQNVSCLRTHQCGSCGGISTTPGISELEKMLKQMTYSRSESQHLMSLLQSRTIEEEPQTARSGVEASLTSGSNKHGDESYNFHASVVCSRILEEEIASPAMLAKTNEDRNATCLPKTPMASPHHPATMESLPDELLSNIFLRLLAKQLAQMRCVKKSWNAMLSESAFVKSHLKRSIQNNDEILLVFHGRVHFSSLIRPLTVKPTQSPSLEILNFIRLPVNPQPEYINCININGIRIIGSVNGLICSSYGDSVIHIWNPSLCAMLALPPYSMPADKSIEFYFRFGYDPKADDYKVVKLTGLKGPSKHIVKWWLQVEIYSMRKGSWEVITERFPSHITEISGEIFSCTDGQNGYLHWLGVVGDEDNSDTIVAFDLDSETFREIPLPFSTRGHYHENFIGVLGIKVCVMLYNEDVEYEVWVMEEYGVVDSWVKRHVFSQSPSFEYTYPFGITSRGKYLIEDGGNFVLYDPSVKGKKHLEDPIAVGQILDKIVEYVDSLVWVAPVKHQMDDGRKS